ncbi:MAG TPA: hypothetical protein VGF21_18555 [Thermoleophilaceae bacterium]|jgi:hypothetical protein
MSTPPRSREREAQRRLSLRTLAIASIASATAAIVVSQFWAGGTPIAAAVTPVLVALVSEMLHRPTEAIARRITSERTAILPADILERERPKEAEPEREEPPAREEPPVRVYGTQRAPRRRQKIAVGVVVTTAVLAFAIAAAALTIPELIAGHSIVKGDRNTTLVPTKRKKSRSSTEQQQQQQQTTPTTTQPQSTQTQTQTTPTQTQTQTTPTQTETTPKSQPK